MRAETNLLAESSVDDQLLCDAQCVVQHGCGVCAAVDGLFQLVEAIGLERNADGLLKPAILEAPVAQQSTQEG